MKERLDRPLGTELAARSFHFAARSYESWLANARAYGTNDVIFWRDLGREWLLPTVRAEFDDRHRLTRAFTRVGLSMPVLERVATRLAPRWAGLVDRVGLDGSGRRLLSGVYNLAYYRGVADELGSVDRFLAITPSDEMPEPGVSGFTT